MTWLAHIHNLASADPESCREVLVRVSGTFTHPGPSSLAVGLVDPVLTGLSFALLLGVAAIGLVRAVRAVRGRRALIPRIIIACAMWLAATAYLTLRPGHSGRLNLVPFAFGANASPFEPVSNVLLFVPLGILIAAVGWRWFAVVGLGLTLSLSIEVTQYLLNIGRTADVNDVIENTLGAFVGCLIVIVVSRLAARRRKVP
jgi:hypothetical protein